MNPTTFFYVFFLIINSTYTQEFNREITLNNQTPYLVGRITTEGLTSGDYKTWYNANYNNYGVDTGLINSVKEELAEYKILIFMGTWCGDSKREIPRFLKVLKAAEFPEKNIKIIGVDRRKTNYKKSPNGEEWGLMIQRVPTIIFLKNGKETNRIIESPVISLEADTKVIIQGGKYVPNYSKSLHFD